jgi:low temperature requirement protein LtrA
MTTSAGTRRGWRSRIVGSVRAAGDDHRVTQFELFFDLVFVFAFTQVTTLMAHEHDAIGVVRGLTVLGILWWSWCSYSWLANQARADHGLLNFGMAVATGLIFVLAFAVPEAYAEHDGPRLAAFVVVACYFLVRAVHIVLYLAAAGDDRQLRRQVLLTMVLAVAPTIAAMTVGAFVGGSAQTWIWLGAWLFDATVVFLTSRAGGEWRLHSAGHWAERYALVVILAIGESIVSVGVGLREVDTDATSILGAFLAIAGAVILWWIYFHRFSAGVEHGLARRTERSRVAEASVSFTYLHFPVVAGVILTALGIETVMAHIGEPEPLGWFGASALAGGVALYQAATVFVWRRLTGRWLVVRLTLATLLLPGIALAAALPPLVALAAVVGLGVVLAVAESRTRVLRLSDAATG